MRRISRLRFAASLSLITLLQALPVEHLKFSGIKPNLLLSALLFFSMFYGEKVGVVAGIIAGALIDVLGGSYIFSNAFSMGIVGYIAGLYKKNLYIQNSLVQVAVTFIASLGVFLFFYLFSQLFIQMAGFWHMFLSLALPTAVYSALTSPAVFWMLRKIQKV